MARLNRGDVLYGHGVDGGCSGLNWVDTGWEWWGEKQRPSAVSDILTHAGVDEVGSGIG